MFSALGLAAIAGWAVLTSPADIFRRVETTMIYQPYVNEVDYMSFGCLSGGVVGAFVGSMPVVTTFGTVVTPYSVPQGALIGCTIGMATGAVGSKLYNSLAFYAKHRAANEP